MGLFWGLGVYLDEKTSWANRMLSEATYLFYFTLDTKRKAIISTL